MPGSVLVLFGEVAEAESATLEAGHWYALARSAGEPGATARAQAGLDRLAADK